MFFKDIQIYIYIYTYIYILFFFATPPETYRFRLFIVFYSDICLFCLQKQPACFPSFEDLKTLDAWMWWVMMLQCFMCRYNDICWWYLQRFRLPYCAPNKWFQFKHWQNAHGAVAKWFLQCFCSFLWHMNFGFWTPSDLADILFDWW